MNINDNYFESNEIILLKKKIIELEQTVKKLEEENQRYRIQLEKDIITQYHLIRQKKNIPFSSIVSKNPLI